MEIKFKKIFILSSILILFLISNNKSYAIYDPLSRNNNIFGIHILFPSELPDAAKLINTNGGDWGYVTIPIQANDKDIQKWQAFMDNAKSLHLIPIIRLSTEEDFIEKGVWRKPNKYDIVDFANFLNSLNWPTKNRYIILFNEVNRFDEWGGEYPNASDYSNLVKLAYDVFKARNNDFYILLAGFDNASVTDYKKYINEFDFLNQMLEYDPDIFNNIDGFASHSYPNPGFDQAPNTYRRMGTYTYNYEYYFINNYTTSQKKAFITETGWDNSQVSDSQIADYYKYAFQNIWEKDKNRIVAVTPFLLNGYANSFGIFSFYKNGTPTLYAQALTSLEKTKGDPEINNTASISKENNSNIKAEKFKNEPSKNYDLKIPPDLKNILKKYFGI